MLKILLTVAACAIAPLAAAYPVIITLTSQGVIESSVAPYYGNAGDAYSLKYTITFDSTKWNGSATGSGVDSIEWTAGNNPTQTFTGGEGLDYMLLAYNNNPSPDGYNNQLYFFAQVGKYNDDPEHNSYRQQSTSFIASWKDGAYSPGPVLSNQNLTFGSDFKIEHSLGSGFDNEHPVKLNPAQHSLVIEVPEPHTYAMLLGGVGLLGVVARRRRKSATGA